jgi:hypothetical protein
MAIRNPGSFTQSSFSRSFFIATAVGVVLALAAQPLAQQPKPAAQFKVFNNRG